MNTNKKTIALSIAGSIVAAIIVQQIAYRNSMEFKIKQQFQQTVEIDRKMEMCDTNGELGPYVDPSMRRPDGAADVVKMSDQDWINAKEKCFNAMK